MTFQKSLHKNFILTLAGIGIGSIGFGLVTPATVMLLELAIILIEPVTIFTPSNLLSFNVN